MAQHAARPARRVALRCLYNAHLIPRRLLQLQKRPVRLLRVQEDDGHAVRAERRRSEYSKAPTLEVSRGRGDIRNLVADVVQAAGRVPLEERRDRPRSRVKPALPKAAHGGH